MSKPDRISPFTMVQTFAGREEIGTRAHTRASSRLAQVHVAPVPVPLGEAPETTLKTNESTRNAPGARARCRRGLRTRLSCADQTFCHSELFNTLTLSAANELRISAEVRAA